MEVKIYCSCGSKYKFDVEPLNGKLPGPVSWPVCGADGTQKGNEVIAQSLAGSSSAAVAAATAAPLLPYRAEAMRVRALLFLQCQNRPRLLLSACQRNRRLHLLRLRPRAGRPSLRFRVPAKRALWLHLFREVLKKSRRRRRLPP